MRIIIEQLEESLDHKLYYLSLITALTIPDIAAALNSKNGEAKKDKYITWFEKYVRPHGQNGIPKQFHDLILSGEECYKFRCALLHQGKSANFKSSHKKIFFIEPGSTRNRGHYNKTEIKGETFLEIDLKLFCLEIIAGTRDWLDKVESTEHYQRNYDASARRHLNSSLPFFKGATIIG
jgi:hypothetical protein